MKVPSPSDRPDVLSGICGKIASQQWAKFAQCLEHARHEYFQRLYDRTPIWKRYRDGKVETHFHFHEPDLLCLRWRRELSGPLEYFLHLSEFPMMVRVGEVAENLEVVPSLVRLMPLEKCDVLVGDTFKEPRPVLYETLLAAFNRKLDITADNSRLRFLLSKSASQIVQWIAKAACEFAKNDLHSPHILIKRIFDNVEATFCGNEISIRMNDVLAKPLQMFVCPIQQEIDFLELIQHAAFLASAEGSL